MLIQRCNCCEKEKSNESTVLWYEVLGQLTGSGNTRHAFCGHACSSECLVKYIGTLPVDTIVEFKVIRS